MYIAENWAVLGSGRNLSIDTWTSKKIPSLKLIETHHKQNGQMYHYQIKIIGKPLTKESQSWTVPTEIGEVVLNWSAVKFNPNFLSEHKNPTEITKILKQV